jgi:hypothetical protein
MEAIMAQSEQIGDLAKALAAAQGAMRTAKHDAKNSFHNSRYTTLAGDWDAAREHLTANDLAVIQSPQPSGGASVHLLTLLVHSSGQWVDSLTEIPYTIETVDKNGHIRRDAQAAKSAYTYARRVGFESIIGLAPGDDDDGEGAMARNRQPAPRSQRTAPRQHTTKPPPLSEVTEQYTRARALVPPDELQDHWRKWIAVCEITEGRQTHTADRVFRLKNLIDSYEQMTRPPAKTYKSRIDEAMQWAEEVGIPKGEVEGVMIDSGISLEYPEETTEEMMASLSDRLGGLYDQYNAR